MLLESFSWHFSFHSLPSSLYVFPSSSSSSSSFSNMWWWLCFCWIFINSQTEYLSTHIFKQCEMRRSMFVCCSTIKTIIYNRKKISSSVNRNISWDFKQNPTHNMMWFESWMIILQMEYIYIYLSSQVFHQHSSWEF